MRMFTKLCAIFGVLLLVSACGLTSRGDLFREALKQKGKKIAGQTLENSEWYICRGARIGAVKDRYGVSRNKIMAYHFICKTDPVGEVFIIDPSVIEE